MDSELEAIKEMLLEAQPRSASALVYLLHYIADLKKELSDAQTRLADLEDAVTALE